MPSWIACAVGSPAISAMTLRPKSIPRGHSSRSDYVAVFYDPCLLVSRPDERQEIGISPMRGDPSPLEQSRNTENERAGANRGDIPGATRLPAHELYGLSIADRPDDTAHAARNANQIEWRTVRERVRGHEAESAIAWDGSLRFGNDVGCRFRQPGEYLQWPCKVELGQIGENDKADVEV
jgi:hypothetical protein